MVKHAEFELFPDADGKWRYRVVGANGEIMVTSQAYADVDNAERGIDDLINAVTQAQLHMEDDVREKVEDELKSYGRHVRRVSE